MPPDFFTNYEKILLQRIADYSRQIQEIYNNAITSVTISAKGIKVENDTPFTLDNNPALNKKIDQVLQKMESDITGIINQATREAFEISKQKNDALVEKLLGKFDFPQKYKDVYFNPNQKALEAFQKRVVDGLNLSARVYNLTEPFKHELEAGLAAGIDAGTSAAKMASQMKQYLNEPDKLFRRVRDENGKLQLSKAAAAYHPGQGVYRSSFKNAMRLTRTEINMGYRTSDQERWIRQPFVLGIEIKLSRQHPKYDICDPCAGIYPKEFVWAGWHPQCICYRVPVLASPAQNKGLTAEILGVKPAGSTELQYVTDMPQGFKDWYANNKDRVAGWSNKPYWLRDNPELIKENELGQVNYTKTVGKNVTDLVRGSEALDTQALYRDPGTGGYNASRLTFQEKLIQNYMKAGSTKAGTSYFLGGAPATGKSSLLDKGLVKLPKGILVVDPDRIKAAIPEYAEMNARNVSTAAAKVHEESSKIAKDIVSNAVERNYDIVNDGIGDGGYDKLVAKVQQQKRAGKRVVAEYITTNTETSIDRALLRGQQTGRFVPEEFIRSMHKEISVLIPELVKNHVFDELRLYDNNGARGSTPKLILEQIGDRVQIYDEELYQKFLQKGF